MSDILTITLNPTVDMTTGVERVVPGRKLRCEVPVFDPGGGGINVARAIRTLGGHAAAFVAVGGATGHHLLDLLADEGLSVTPFPVRDETRQSVTVDEASSGEQFRFVMPGPEWTPAMVSDALHQIGDAAREGSLAVLSGSQPPGVAPDFPAELARRLAARSCRLVVDTSGAAQRHLVEHPADVFLLRMDAGEAEDLAGRPLTERGDSADFGSELVAAGVARMVIIGRGADGSTLVGEGLRLHCRREIDTVRSKVGAGDSLVAAFVLALSRDLPVDEALRRGVAAASAAVLTDATKLCRRDDAEGLIEGCELTTI